ncbi:MAG: histidinol-phosphate transaminase [Actinomycetaceae bacterium]|nr:histidinol-phosphate transaminase [Actinomycetaceae bacterium]
MNTDNPSCVNIREDVLAFPKIVTPPAPQGENPAFLAANEHPVAPPLAVRQAAGAALANCNRYPDMATTDLITQVAAFHQVDPTWVATGAGSSALLVHALSLVANPGANVVFAWRSFEAYPFVTQVVGSKPKLVPLNQDQTHDLDAMAQAVDETTSAVIICNPNNPTGTVVTTAQIRRFLEQVDPRVLVIVDEAYIDYVNDPQVGTALSLVAEFENLLVARTFSKAYGLAGVRVGYMVGQPQLIQYLRSVTLPFSVSAVAQEAAIAMLLQPQAVAEGVSRTVAERSRMLTALRELGLPVPRSQTNFFWLPGSSCLGMEPAQAAQVFAQAGIAVRAFPDGVRIALGTAQDNDRVLELLRSAAS